MTNRTKRDRMKRKVAQAHNNLENVMLDVKVLYDLFDGVHPELAEGLQLIAETTLLAQIALELFAQNAWNMSVESIQKFR